MINCVPQGAPHTTLITLERVHPGHDLRYSINRTLIRSEVGWQSRRKFEKSVESIVRWFLDNLGL